MIPVLAAQPYLSGISRLSQKALFPNEIPVRCW